MMEGKQYLAKQHEQKAQALIAPIIVPFASSSTARNQQGSPGILFIGERYNSQCKYLKTTVLW
jgi:hypothetical protein